jgi:mannose-6-phosphate isomerase-like protein (cupin superfamily)
MNGKYMSCDVRDTAALSQLSRAITSWDPLLSLKFSRGESLYGGILTSYGLCVGQASTLTFRDRTSSVHPGDAIVLAPSIRVACQPASEFLWICYEGLAPEHLRGAAAVAAGMEHFPFEAAGDSRSICGARREVLPATDLRHRVQYHFVVIDRPEPHTHQDMVELYYVQSGTGEVRIGPTMQDLSTVTVAAGQVLAVGPGLFHVPSDGLGMCIWFLYHETAHRRRVREAAARVSDPICQ